MKQNKILAEHKEAPALDVRARVAPQSLDKESRTVDLVYTAGARVLRRDWWQGISYHEELSLEKGHVRLDRLNNGAPLLNSHATWELNNQIGVVERADETTCRVRFSNREDVQPIFDDVADGIIRNVSVGYIVHKYEEVGYDETDGLPIYRAVDWEPFEVSLVTVPADAKAGVRKRSVEMTSTCVVFKSEAMEAEELNLREEDTAMINKDKAADGGANQDPANAPAAPAPGADTRALVEQATEAEFNRQAGIRSAVTKAGLDTAFGDELVNGKVTLDTARERIIDKLAEAQPPASRAASGIIVGNDLSAIAIRDGMENAIMHRVNPSLTPLTDVGKQFRGMSMMTMARDIIGYEKTRGMSPREIATLALGGRVEGRAAMHTTSDLPEILANVANKTLRQAYAQTKRNFTKFSRKTYLPDFKEISRVALGNATSLSLILEGGEYKSGTFVDGAEKYRLFTYGKKINFSREMLINDDLDALSRVPQMFAGAAGRLENKLVFGILTANPNLADGNALFNASPDANLITGALGVAGLGKARARLRTVKDPSGEDILNLEPAFVVVPAAQELTAAQLQTAITPNQVNQTNPWANTYETIVEGMLDASSTAAYYVIANPSEIDTIEYAYLEGEEGPYIESRNGFDVDGVEIKVRHDFAAKAIDRRGMVKMSGAD